MPGIISYQARVAQVQVIHVMAARSLQERSYRLCQFPFFHIPAPFRLPCNSRSMVLCLSGVLTGLSRGKRGSPLTL